MALVGKSGSDSVNDPYKILGVERTATGDDIAKAYRKKAMDHSFNIAEIKTI